MLYAAAFCPQSEWRKPILKAGEKAEPTQSKPRDTFFEHSDTAKWWISGQANFVFQAHGDFLCAVQWPQQSEEHFRERNLPRAHAVHGLRIHAATPPFISTSKRRDGAASAELWVWRASPTSTSCAIPASEPRPISRASCCNRSSLCRRRRSSRSARRWSLQTELPARRLEIRVGKFSTADFFDYNIGGTDSHYQFLNWVIDNNGAYDYAADTRGYTMGVILDYEDRNWGLRFGELLMPKVANGPELSWDIANSRAENIELELRPTLLKDRDTKIRFLSYINHADMGNYRDSILLYKEGLTPTPDITATRDAGNNQVRFRDSTSSRNSPRTCGPSGGGDGTTARPNRSLTRRTSPVSKLERYFVGTRWGRSLDRAGAAFVSSGIKSYHQQYLADGGLGFILGDGGLTYGRENIEEMFYTVHAWRGLFFAVDLQHVNNPGYNQVRGPVTVPGVRMHLEF